MLWPLSASDGYIKLLRERHPAALVVLSHYCVVVHATESKTWFTRGWASKVIRAIEATLPPEWAEMIQWPLESVRSAVP